MKLRELVKAAPPSIFDIDALSIPPALENCLNGRDLKEVPFLWGLNNISSEFEKI